MAVSAAPIVAGIATYKAGIKTDEVAGKSRGEVFFEEAKQAESVKDRLGFLARVKDEVSELFSFLHTLEEETEKKLVIVPFVDDLDRVIGGNGDRVTKVLEAVSLILSIENAPVITFLAIDPRIDQLHRRWVRCGDPRGRKGGRKRGFSSSSFYERIRPISSRVSRKEGGRNICAIWKRFK